MQKSYFKTYLLAASFFCGAFLMFNIFFILYRIHPQEFEFFEPSQHNLEERGPQLSLLNYTINNQKSQLEKKDRLIKDLEDKLSKLMNEKQENVQNQQQVNPEVPGGQEAPAEQAVLPDLDSLLGADARVKTVVKRDKTTGKDIIQPWSKYSSIYKNFVEKKLDKNFLPQDFIIAIVTANRPTYLGATLRSLQQVLYWNRDNTIIYQYGDDKTINMIANSYKIKQVKNTVQNFYQGKQITEGAEHIAIHYRFVIDRVFRDHPQAKYFIVLEDDMILAPDLLLYFSQMAPLMEKDHNIYSVSAYNDNGFRGMVKDTNVVQRTDFFIGLGWLVSRRLWESEWSASWPRTHWDHFLRNPMNRRDRQTLYPEVSRIYHSGYKGTHSTVALYEKYFRDIVLNRQGYAPMGLDKKNQFVRVSDKNRDDVSLDYISSPSNFSDYFTKLIDPKSPDVIYLNTIQDASKLKNKRIVMAYEAQPLVNRAWMTISEYFDIWHTVPVRSEYLGVTPINWMNGNTVYMMASYSTFYNRFEELYKKPKPELVPAEDFQVDPPWLHPREPSVLSIAVAAKGESCSSLCLNKFGPNSKCDLYKISEINTCRYLKKHFKCETCAGNIGHDQPAFDTESNTCLFNTGSRQYMTTCEGSHPKTQRLCACFDPKTVVTFHEEWETMIANSQSQCLLE